MRGEEHVLSAKGDHLDHQRKGEETNRRRCSDVLTEDLSQQTFKRHFDVSRRLKARKTNRGFGAVPFGKSAGTSLTNDANGGYRLADTQGGPRDS